MKPLWTGPVLANQRGTVLANGTVRLILEEQLGHASARQRVDESKEHQANDRHDERST